MIEMYVLVNGHTLWRNFPHLMEGLSKDAMSQSQFRFSIIRVWYAVCCFQDDKWKNGSTSLSWVSACCKQRKLDQTLMSPRKDRHHVERIGSSDSSAKRCRLKCRVCKRKSSHKCGKCSNPGDPLVLCSYEIG